MAIAFFVDRLRSCYPLADADIAIAASFGSNVIRHHRHAELLRQGEYGTGAGVLLSGMACRYKHARGGKRQIVGLLVPGDVFGLEGVLKDTADHGVMTLTDSEVGWVTHARLREIFDRHSAVCLALWKLFVADTHIYREWLLNIGSRSALERMAHLICELCVRFEKVGQASDREFPWPLTQAQLSEILGITPVHVNRTLQRLRKAGSIGPTGNTMRIMDWPGLVEVAQFDGAYLGAG